MLEMSGNVFIQDFAHAARKNQHPLSFSSISPLLTWTLYDKLGCYLS